LKVPGQDDGATRKVGEILSADVADMVDTKSGGPPCRPMQAEVNNPLQRFKLSTSITITRYIISP
jgi:hypothetical protein